MSLLVKILGVALALVYLMAGGNKITDKIDQNTYNYLQSAFPNYHKAFSQFGPLPLTSQQFARAIGVTEVAAAVLLLTPLHVLANWVLAAIMIGAIYAHVASNEPYTVPAVLLGVLVLRLVLIATSKPSAPAKRSTKKVQ